jgi:hypothetical protein
LSHECAEPSSNNGDASGPAWSPFPPVVLLFSGKPNSFGFRILPPRGPPKTAHKVSLTLSLEPSCLPHQSCASSRETRGTVWCVFREAVKCAESIPGGGWPTEGRGPSAQGKHHCQRKDTIRGPRDRETSRHERDESPHFSEIRHPSPKAITRSSMVLDDFEIVEWILNESQCSADVSRDGSSFRCLCNLKDISLNSLTPFAPFYFIFGRPILATLFILHVHGDIKGCSCE